MDPDHNGLSQWMGSPQAGEDEPDGVIQWGLGQHYEGVDLNSYLVRECRAFARLAELGGKYTLAANYREAAAQRIESIRALCWDEADGFFYDHHPQTGEHIRVKSSGVFAALFAGVPTADQARRLVYDHLMNASEFWTPYPLSTLALNTPWQREWLPEYPGSDWTPAVWVPANYMAYHGLRTYGYHELASLLAYQTTRLVSRSGCRDSYNAMTGVGVGPDRFCGWSLLAHFLPYEEQQEERIYNPAFGE